MDRESHSYIGTIEAVQTRINDCPKSDHIYVQRLRQFTRQRVLVSYHLDLAASFLSGFSLTQISNGLYFGSL